jgi:uncharacterized membrane protein YkvA (DUF1232 family)
MDVCASGEQPLVGAVARGRKVIPVAWVKETVLALPRVVALIAKLMADERVPARTKIALAGLAVYLASPWDFIPDFIPVLGQLDDAVAILLFLDGVLNVVDDAVLAEHWTGELRTLRRLQTLARVASRWTPARLKRFLFGRAAKAASSRLQRPAPSP